MNTYSTTRATLTGFKSIDLDLGDVNVRLDGNDDGRLRDLRAGIQHRHSVLARGWGHVLHGEGAVTVVLDVYWDVLSLCVGQGYLYLACKTCTVLSQNYQ